MDDTVEKSSFYDTSGPGPDLERHPNQKTNEQSQPRIHHRKEKKDGDNNDSIMEYGEEQDNRALYQPMCGKLLSS